MANEIYNTSAWGSPMEIGWGSIYYRFAFPSAIPALLVTLQGRATYYENVTCTTATLTELENIE
tara:strand:+ start:604 stop:795 length:192 start_codon:yes stop_codon:yes gene_type:complete